VDCNSLPVSIIIGCANEHDSTKFVDVLENISEYLDCSAIRKIKSAYADKGYDAHSIREYLKNRNISPCIPKRNFKTDNSQIKNHTNYNQIRYVVERFFAWLKNGFHRTRIRYEKIAENYLAFVNIASIMMYWRVLG